MATIRLTIYSVPGMRFSFRPFAARRPLHEGLEKLLDPYFDSLRVEWVGLDVVYGTHAGPRIEVAYSEIPVQLQDFRERIICLAEEALHEKPVMESHKVD